MSKLDIGVGEEFPLEQGDPADRRAWKEEHRAHRRAMREHWRHHRHHHHGRHHHRHHPLHLAAHLVLLAAVGGFVALIIAGKIPAAAAYGLLAAILILAFVRHIRHHA